MYISSIYHVTSLYLWYVLVVLSEQITWNDIHEACRSRRFGGHQPETAKHGGFLNRRKTTTRCVSLFFISHHLGIYMFLYVCIYYIYIVWLFMPEFGKKVESGYKILDRMVDNSWNQHFWSQSSFLESAIDVPPGSRQWFCSHVLSPNQKWGIHHTSIIHIISYIGTVIIFKWVLQASEFSFDLGVWSLWGFPTKGVLICNPLWRPPWRPWKTSSKKAAKVANSRSFPRRNRFPWWRNGGRVGTVPCRPGPQRDMSSSNHWNFLEIC